MTAKGLLKPVQDVSPDDLADDDVACVESLESVYKKAFGTFIGGNRPLLSTIELHRRLMSDARFQRISTPVAGAIILSPTGSGNGSIRGHVGICGLTHIMANNSNTGNWSADYSYDQWQDRWARRGGMPVYFFRPV